MKIANFREYTSVLREIYTGEAMAETGSYYYALISSGKDLAKKKAELQEKISRLNKAIQKQAAQIREAKDKKTAGLQMAKLKKIKQNLVSLLKDLQNSDHFNVLGEDAKTCVCSGFLLQKYLTAELIKNNPLQFAVNENEDLIVDTTALRQSDIFQEAVHIKDFVAAYIARYPEKVKTPGHFKTMLNGVNTWQELLNYAENFFEKLNDNEFLKDGPVKASRLGTEVIIEFPEEKLQLVRLHTEKALDYESDKMQHCVGSGGYDKGVKSGKKHIYSLRDISEDGEWLPHVTIEYGEGKIKQVKGFKNKEIDAKYIPIVRQAVFHILGSSDISKLYSENKLSDLEKWGYILDVNNQPHDLYNISEEIHLDCLYTDSPELKIIPQHLLHLNKLICQKNIDEETINMLRNFQKVDRIETWDHTPVSNPMATRRMLWEYLGDTSIENIEKRLGRNLLEKIGFIYDTDKKLHDLLNLKREIQIYSIAQNAESIRFIPGNMVSANEFTITSDIDETLVSVLNKFKKINELKINDNIVISNPLQARSILSDYINLPENADKELQAKLGFMQRWDPEEPTPLINIDKVQEYYKTHPRILIDALNIQEQEKLKYISTKNSLFTLLNHGKITFKKVQTEGKVTPETIKGINNLAGIHYLNIKEADFADIASLNLSRINFRPTPDSVNKDITFCGDEMLLEGTTIPRFVSDRAVSINSCSNLPPLTSIEFPHNVRHIMIVPKEKQISTLPDFRIYPQLESLQLNNIDLSENTVIYLPKSLKYLAFYDCKFGQEINLDLRELQQLEELRLNKCDLSNIENVSVPQSLEMLSAEDAKLKKGVTLPKIKPKTPQIKHFLNNIQIVDAR